MNDLEFNIRASKLLEELHKNDAPKKLERVYENWITSNSPAGNAECTQAIEDFFRSYDYDNVEVSFWPFKIYVTLDDIRASIHYTKNNISTNAEKIECKVKKETLNVKPQYAQIKINPRAKNWFHALEPLLDPSDYRDCKALPYISGNTLYVPVFDGIENATSKLLDGLRNNSKNWKKTASWIADRIEKELAEI